MQKGMQVAPAELEDLLLGHPDIADACVTALYRAEEATEVPRAFSEWYCYLDRFCLKCSHGIVVQLKGNRPRTEELAVRIIHWANGKLAK
jgi:hypothetical protein